MEIIDNRAVVLHTPSPQRVLNTIPASKQIDDDEVVVKFGVREAQTLRDLRFDVPSPILYQYKWTGRHAPFEHQRDTAAFLTLHQRCFCFNEQGTGKTAAAIWAADFLMKKGLVNRVLVICPVSIMDSAWRADIFTFAMHRRVDVAYGDKKKRARVIDGKSEFVIINYEGVATVWHELKAGGFDLIIVDEATHYKNAQTKRWKALNTLLNKDTWLWLMTGTPAAQSPEDAFGLAKLVSPSNVPRYFGAWRDMVMVKINQFRWVPKRDAPETVHHALQPAIRFKKEDCLDLPDMVYTRRDVQLSPQQKKYYEKMRKELILSVAGESVSGVNAAVLANKLLQISGGGVYTDEGDTMAFDIGTRYRVLKEVIEETSQKVIVFVPFRHAMEILRATLEDDGYKVGEIHGDVKIHMRTKLFKQFQTEADPEILLIQPQAAAHGVTLTAADTVVWWLPTPSLETYAQANARIHRAGQTHKCTVVQLAGSTVERKLYRMLDDRISIHERTTQLYDILVD